MDSPDPSERRLPAWIQAVYEVLEPRIIDHDGGLPADRAPDLILEHTPDDLTLEPADADHALQRLLERGYLYEVGGRLFVTEPETTDTDDG